MGKSRTDSDTGLKGWDKFLLWALSPTWFVLFAAGLLVSTLPYRLAISPLAVSAAEMANDVQPAGSLLLSWLVVLTCYTPTNVALLSVVAGVLGSLGCRARLGPTSTGSGNQKAQRSPCDQINPNLSGFLRGLFVYLAVISGLLVLVEDPFEVPTPQQYARLAGFISLLSFVTSYRSAIFAGLLDRVADALRREGE